MNTSGHVYDDFVRLLFLHTYREASILAGELPEESDQFRFLRSVRLANLKDSVGLILVTDSGMRVTISLFCREKGVHVTILNKGIRARMDNKKKFTASTVTHDVFHKIKVRDRGGGGG